jgi:hypothetical protein
VNRSDIRIMHGCVGCHVDSAGTSNAAPTSSQ